VHKRPHLCAVWATIHYIVKIDSIIWSLCLCHVYMFSSEETHNQCCVKVMPNLMGIRNVERNKDQLLHRIASVQTTLTYNSYSFPEKKHFLLVTLLYRCSLKDYKFPNALKDTKTKHCIIKYSDEYLESLLACLNIRIQ